MADWTAIFPVLKKITDQFQGRIERLKNERDDLEKELSSINNKPCTDSLSKRKAYIVVRLKKIGDILANKAKDD